MIARFQVAFGADTALPRDKLMINPHFEETGVVGSADWEALATDLADALHAWGAAKSTTREITVSVYDAQGSEPVRPEAVVIKNSGITPASTKPREVAICLSYFSGINAPRRRGRLYIPATVVMPSGDLAGVRPSPAARADVGSLANVFANLGGTNIDWVVYSRVDNDARPVSNWFVDDEWDTVRSRGLRSTTRTVGTVDE